jgi:hypothetical protein
VFFSHHVVKNRFGFDDLRIGQQLEYILEIGPHLHAISVQLYAASSLGNPQAAA